MLAFTYAISVPYDNKLLLKVLTRKHYGSKKQLHEFFKQKLFIVTDNKKLSCHKQIRLCITSSKRHYKKLHLKWLTTSEISLLVIQGYRKWKYSIWLISRPISDLK